MANPTTQDLASRINRAITNYGTEPFHSSMLDDDGVTRSIRVGETEWQIGCRRSTGTPIATSGGRFVDVG